VANAYETSDMCEYQLCIFCRVLRLEFGANRTGNLLLPQLCQKAGWIYEEGIEKAGY